MQKHFSENQPILMLQGGFFFSEDFSFTYLLLFLWKKSSMSAPLESRRKNKYLKIGRVWDLFVSSSGRIKAELQRVLHAILDDQRGPELGYKKGLLSKVWPR